MVALRQISSSAPPSGGSAPVAITNVTVIDATGAPAQPGMTVIVRADRIAALGASRQVPAPRDATVIDGTGKFLIPGLWDMHVHAYDRIVGEMNRAGVGILAGTDTLNPGKLLPRDRLDTMLTDAQTAAAAQRDRAAPPG